MIRTLNECTTIRNLSFLVTAACELRSTSYDPKHVLPQFFCSRIVFLSFIPFLFLYFSGPFLLVHNFYRIIFPLVHMYMGVGIYIYVYVSLTEN